jgi:hypothetical protein
LWENLWRNLSVEQKSLKTSSGYTPWLYALATPFG